MMALEDILSAPRGSLKESDTRDTVHGWSSIVDVQILAFLSSELGVESDPDLLTIETVGDLLDALTERRAITA
jgi:acyl carrier protein